MYFLGTIAHEIVTLQRRWDRHIFALYVISTLLSWAVAYTVWTNMQLEWSATDAAVEAARMRARLDLAIAGLGDQTDKVARLEENLMKLTRLARLNADVRDDPSFT